MTRTIRLIAKVPRVEDSSDEWRATAKLLAAAPQLLKQCQNLHEWFTSFRNDLILDGYGQDTTNDMIDQLQAVITAAGGTT